MMSKLLSSVVCLFLAGLFLVIVGCHLVSYQFIFEDDSPAHDESDDFDVIVLGRGLGGLSATAKFALEGQKVLFIQNPSTGSDFGTCAPNKFATDVNGEKWHSDINTLTLTESFGSSKLFDLVVSELNMSKKGFFRLDKAWRNIIGNQSLDFYANKTDFMHTFLKYCNNDDKCEKGLEKMIMRTVRIYEQFMDLMDIDAQAWTKKISRISLLPLNYFETLVSNMASAKLFVRYHLGIGESILDLLTMHLEITEGVDSKLLPSWFYGLSLGSLFSEDGGQYIPNYQCKDVVHKLKRTIKLNGGHILTKRTVKQIKVDNYHVAGVILRNGTEYKTKVVVSDLSLHETVDLVGRDKLYGTYLDDIDLLQPSPTIAIADVYVKNTEQLEQIFGNYTSIHFKSTVKEEKDEGEDELCSSLLKITRMDKVDSQYRSSTPVSGKKVLRIATQSKISTWKTLSKDTNRNTVEETFVKCIAEKVGMLHKDIQDFTSNIVWNPLEIERALGFNTSHFSHLHTRSNNLFFCPKLASPVKGLFFASADVYPGYAVHSSIVSGIMAAKTVLAGRNMKDLPYYFYIGLFSGFIGGVLWIIVILITTILLMQKLSGIIQKVMPEAIRDRLSFPIEDSILEKDEKQKKE